MFSGVAVLIQLSFFVNMAVSDVLGEILLTRSHKLGESLKKKKTEQGRWCLWGQKSCLLVCLFACRVGLFGTGVGEGVGGVVVGEGVGGTGTGVGVGGAVVGEQSPEKYLMSSEP